MGMIGKQLIIMTWLKIVVVHVMMAIYIVSI